MKLEYFITQHEQIDPKLKELEKVHQQKKPAKHKLRKEAKNLLNPLNPSQLQLACLWCEAKKSNIKNYIFDHWQTSQPQDYFSFLESFSFIPNGTSVETMPELSFMFHIPFTLETAYISKDESNFHILDNPIRREKIFQVPMIASTSWKGTLKATMLRQLAEWWHDLAPEDKKKRCNRKKFLEQRIQIGRLFGTEKDNYESYLDNLDNENLAARYKRYLKLFISKTEFFAGCLHFYPTFFNKSSLEVINPHDRRTGVGKRGPIFIEVVPPKTTGTFVLLYVPFYFQKSRKNKQNLVVTDLTAIAKSILLMLTQYGFGAKTSSGFGKAEDKLDSNGTLTINEGVKVSNEEPKPESTLSKTKTPQITFSSLQEMCKTVEILAQSLQNRGDI